MPRVALAAWDHLLQSPGGQSGCTCVPTPAQHLSFRDKMPLSVISVSTRHDIHDQRGAFFCIFTSYCIAEKHDYVAT